jgi:hypothetical protein
MGRNDGEEIECIRAAMIAEERYERIGHIFNEGEKHSAQAKKNSAMAHFDLFLLVFFRLVGNYFMLNGVAIIPNHKQLQPKDITDKLVGNFATFLGKCARTKDKKKAPLSYSTARGYFSSFKMYFLHKFSGSKTPEVLTNQKFRMYATALTALIVERCKKTNEPLVAQKRCATKEDWVALATLCAWSGRADAVQFWHFNNSTTQMASRGNEVAFLRHSHVTPVSIEGNFQNTYTLASVFVNIWKQTSSQDCHICPHIDSWQLDWYFSNAVLLAMTGHVNETEYVCPAYGARASKEDHRQKKNGSGVSSLWTDKFKSMVQFFEGLKEGQEGEWLLAGGSFQKISSHAGKQYAVQNMSSNCNVVQIIFRAGWDVRNLHTLFDYLQREKVHDLEAAKACAGWQTKLNDSIYGGYTNKVEDLTVRPDLFYGFCQVLFHNDGTNK